ncbi:hypothetical protein K2X33_05150 [bacterium]|nr:hypothetical protein [bacterium]MBY0510200.1 hypothetical protein [Rhodospirillaceae bacterium]
MVRAQEKVFDHCGPALQEFLTEVQAEAKKNGDPIPQAWVVSAASARMAVNRGQLNANIPRAVNSTLRKRLDGSSLSDAICFLGWDVSLNFNKVKLKSQTRTRKWKRKNEHWQVHIYGIVFAASKAAIHTVFDPIFWHQMEEGDKPVKVYPRAFKDIPLTSKYVLKPNFIQRENNRHLSLRPNKWNLKAGEKDELAMFLGDLGFKDRLLLKGVKLVRGTLIRTKGLPHQSKSKTQEELSKRLLGASTGLFGPPRKK